MHSAVVRCHAFCPVLCTPVVYIALPVCTLNFLSVYYYTSGLSIITFPVCKLHFRSVYYTSGMYFSLSVYTLGPSLCGFHHFLCDCPILFILLTSFFIATLFCLTSPLESQCLLECQCSVCERGCLALTKLVEQMCRKHCIAKLQWNTIFNTKFDS